MPRPPPAVDRPRAELFVIARSSILGSADGPHVHKTGRTRDVPDMAGQKIPRKGSVPFAWPDRHRQAAPHPFRANFIIVKVIFATPDFRAGWRSGLKDQKRGNRIQGW